MANVVDIVFRGRDEVSRTIASVRTGLTGIASVAGSLNVFAFTQNFALLIGLAKRAAAAVRESAEEMDALATSADRIGIGVEALQEIRFAAVALDVPVEQLDRNLLLLSRNIALAGQGTGPLLEAADRLQRLTGVKLELFDAGRLRDTNAVFTDLIAILGSVADEQQRNAIAFDLFTLRGAKLVQLGADGGRALSGLREEAHRLGVVIDQETVRSAGELSDRLDLLAVAAKANLNRALIQLVPVLIDVGEGMLVITRAAAELVLRLSDIENLSPVTVEFAFGSDEAALDAIERRIFELRSQQQFIDPEAFDPTKLGPAPEFDLLDDLQSGLEAVGRALGEDSAAARQLEQDLKKALEQQADLQARAGQARRDFTLGLGGVPTGQDAAATDAAAASADAATGALNELALATRGYENEAKIASATTDEMRARLQALVGLEQNVLSVVQKMKSLPVATAEALVLASREGPGALQQALRDTGEAGTQLGVALVGAIRSYEAQLGEAARKQTAFVAQTLETTRRAVAEVQQIAREAGNEAIVIPLTIGAPIAGELEATLRQIQGTLAQRLATLDQAALVPGVDPGAVAAARAQAQAAAAQATVAAEREAGEARRVAANTVLDALLTDEQRSQAERLRSIEEFSRAAAELVREGAITEQQAVAAVSAEWEKIQLESSAWASAFDVDLSAAGANAMRTFGESFKTEFAQFVRGEKEFGDALRDLFVNALTSASQQLAEAGFSHIMDSIIEGLLTKQQQPVPVTAQIVGAVAPVAGVGAPSADAAAIGAAATEMTGAAGTMADTSTGFGGFVSEFGSGLLSFLGIEQTVQATEQAAQVSETTAQTTFATSIAQFSAAVAQFAATAGGGAVLGADAAAPAAGGGAPAGGAPAPTGEPAGPTQALLQASLVTNIGNATIDTFASLITPIGLLGFVDRFDSKLTAVGFIAAMLKSQIQTMTSGATLVLASDFNNVQQNGALVFGQSVEEVKLQLVFTSGGGGGGASAQHGAITTRTGMVLVHPHEAILPIEMLRGYIRDEQAGVIAGLRPAAMLEFGKPPVLPQLHAVVLFDDLPEIPNAVLQFGALPPLPRLAIGLEGDARALLHGAAFGVGGGGYGGGYITPTDLGRMASLAHGGITTQSGVVQIHPGEAILKVGVLRQMIREESGGGTVIAPTIVFGETGSEGRRDGRSEGERAAALTAGIAAAMDAYVRSEQRPGGLLEGTGPRSVRRGG